MSADTAPAVWRPLPPPLEHPLPPCSLCGETVEYDGVFFCRACGASWDSEGSHLDGHSSWDDPTAEQCNRTIQPYKGSVRYPALATIVSHCLLTVDHDGNHRDGEDDWDNSAVDGYLTERPS